MKIVRPIVINDAALASSNIPETDYTAYNSGTTYALGDWVRVVSANVHEIYQSLQAGNLNHAPATSPTWWLDGGATNRWKMFDGSVGSQSSNPDSIDDVFSISGRLDSVILLNVDAASAQVIMTDAIAGVVYSKTVSLISDSGIMDWYAYFFEPVVRKADAVFSDLLPYLNPSVEVILLDTGGTPRCGECVLGLSRLLGDTQRGIGVGIQDYSIKQVDAFGDYSVLERAFNKHGKFTVEVPNTFIDELQTLLAGYRAIPVVFLGTDIYASTIIYGFYKDFDVNIAYPRMSICSIELEGLT